MSTDLWSFKYHPSTLDDMILTDRMRDKLNTIADNKSNITLVGSAGIGKGTFTDIYIKDGDFDVLRINGSMATGIDMVRDKILTFATALGFSDKMKLVYLNEADRISVPAQDSLRDLMEQVQDTTRFILLCNEPQRITDPIISRCPLLIFDEPPMKDLAKHCINILKKEGVKYNTKSVIDLIKQTGTDVRHTINTMQLNVKDGVLSDNLVVTGTSEFYQKVLGSMLTCDPSQVRKTVRSNPIDYTRLYDYLYNTIMDNDQDDIFKNDAQAMMLISEYAYRDGFVAIKELNFMGMVFKFLMEGIL